VEAVSNTFFSKNVVTQEREGKKATQMSEAETAAAGCAEEEETLSALRANISSKGSNAYYYAHSHKATGPVWDGKEEPRLLERVELDAASSSSGGGGGSSTKNATPIVEYGWSDGKKIVSIYVDFEGALNVSDEQISLETRRDGFTFTLQNVNDKNYVLLLDKLNADIESASYKKKEGKFTIILKKGEEKAWYSLKKT